MHVWETSEDMNTHKGKKSTNLNHPQSKYVPVLKIIMMLNKCPQVTKE